MNQQNKWYHAKVSPEVHANGLSHRMTQSYNKNDMAFPQKFYMNL